MSFLSATFLYGMLAAAIPLAIHLIQRQRYPERAFTTLRFFDRTIKNNTIQRRIIDKILLAMRMLALLAIAFALARPFSNSSFGEHRSSVVIVLDNSPSMSRQSEGQPLFEKGRRVAQGTLAKLSETDRAAVVLTAPLNDPMYFTQPDDVKREVALRQGQPMGLWTTDEKSASLAVPGLTQDAERIHKVVASMAPGQKVGVSAYAAMDADELSYDKSRDTQLLAQARISGESGNAAAALARAAALLRTSQDGDRKIVFISCMQRAEFEGQQGQQGQQGRQADLQALAGLSLVVIPVESPEMPGTNLGIEGVALPVREADFGQTIAGVATIRNYGTRVSEEAKLTIQAGDMERPVDVRVPSILPHTAMSIAFPILVMSHDRNLLCSAHVSMPTDSFSYDDNWYFQIGVRFPVQTLCVNGVAAGASADSEAFYLMNALSSRSSSNPAAAESREISIAEFEKRRLTEFNVLILAGVQSLDAAAREKIREFAADGKGVLIFPGSNATNEEYNAWSFLPAQFVEKKSKDFVYLKSIDERAPALATVREHAGSGIHALSTSMRFILQPSAGSRVLARFSDGSPALVEGDVGKGHVILAATGAHTSQSDWPLRPAFVLLVRSMVKYLGADLRPTTLAPERLVGEGAATLIPPEMVGATPAVFRVDRPRQYESLPWYQSGRTLMLPCAQQDGQHLLTIQPGTEEGILSAPKMDTGVVPVSVNHSVAASDLTAMTIDDFQTLLPKSTQLKTCQLNDSPEVIAAALYSGRDLCRWILLGALVLLALESVVAWRSASEAAA